MLRNCRHKYFLIYVSFYVNCSEELDRCGVCFAKLIKHHVSACLVLHLIFYLLRKLLGVSGGATLCHRGLPTPTFFEKINGKLLYLSLWPQSFYAQDPGDPVVWLRPCTRSLPETSISHNLLFVHSPWINFSPLTIIAYAEMQNQLRI